MVIQPKVRGFICTTAHPMGCYEEVASQIHYLQSQTKIAGPKNVLVIGSSTGYGLASRIVATFAGGANTIGVFYERPSDEKRTASAGWYNTAAFEKIAHAENRYAKSINGDAFSDAVKQQTIELIRKDLQKIDLIIYSLASPRRVHPQTGTVYSSVLKPLGEPFTSKTVDPFQGEVKEVTIQPATQEEVNNTVQVMGGEDWEMWLDLLAQENLLAENIMTVAYSYIGPELTHSIYKEGTIGKAKEHLHQTAHKLTTKLKGLNGKAFVSVNKALVTQASAAIPVVPLYISLLFKLMKEAGTHEGCIEQIYRLFKDFLYADSIKVDDRGLIRIDDLEMQPAIQEKIATLWPIVTSENLEKFADIEGYRNDFIRLFGFNNPAINYEKPVDPEVKIDSLRDELIANEG